MRLWQTHAAVIVIALSAVIAPRLTAFFDGPVRIDLVAPAMTGPGDAKAEVSGDAAGAREEESSVRIEVSDVVAPDAEAEALEVYMPYLPPRAYWADPASIGGFEDLQRELTAFLEGSEGIAAVAVYRPDDGFSFGLNQERALPLASVAKLHILLAYLNLVRSEGRGLTADEEPLLEAMITVSDNYSADELWLALGGEPLVQAYLASLGFVEVAPAEEGRWGASLHTPRDLALLLARLYAGELLDPAGTEFVLSLLSRVDLSQRWGVTSGLEAGEDATRLLAYVYMKDGWYPGAEGWRVNSAGLIVPADGSPAYALVVLSDSQPSYEYGIETVTTISRLINALMQSVGAPQATATAGPPAP